MQDPNDPLSSALNQFKDLRIAEDEFEALLQRAITHGVRPDPSEWLRDRPVEFYFGMLATWRLYASFHRKYGIAPRNSATGRLLDDEVGDEIILVLTSLTV